MQASTAASVVALNPVELAARERDAKELMAKLAATTSAAADIKVLSGVALTVPFILQVIVVAEEEGREDSASTSPSAAITTTSSSTKNKEKPWKGQEEVEAILEATWKLVDSTVNDFNPDSEISKLNRSPVGTSSSPTKIQADSPLGILLIHCVYFNSKTDGQFEPCFTPLRNALVERAKENFSTTTMTSPAAAGDDVTLDKLRHTSCLKNSFNVTLVEGGGEGDGGEGGGSFLNVRRLHTDAYLSLGGISKGWAVDFICERLQSSGFTSALMDWGGEIKALGSSSTAVGGWTVGIVAPPSLEQIRNTFPNSATSATTAASDATKKYLRVVTLRDGEALATSGDYEHLACKNAYRVATPTSSSPSSCSSSFLTNIVDPSRGVLLSVGEEEEDAQQLRLSQVTVVHSTSCMVADALATCTLLCGEFSKAREFLESWDCSSIPDSSQLLLESSSTLSSPSMLLPSRVGVVVDYTLSQRKGDLLATRPSVTEVPAAKKARMASTISSRRSRVVVVGGGLAGLAAAVEACRSGANVTLCEKSQNLGGNSSKATTGINGCGTAEQRRSGIHDDGRKLFEEDIFASAVGGGGAGGTYNPALIQTISAKSVESIEWLTAITGLDLSKVTKLGGHQRARTHRLQDRKEDGTVVPIGFSIMSALIQKLYTSPEFCGGGGGGGLERESDKKENGDRSSSSSSRRTEEGGGTLEIRLGCAVSSLDKQGSPDGKQREVDGDGEDGSLWRVGLTTTSATQSESSVIFADAVILTTGGFGNERRIPDGGPSSPSAITLFSEFAPKVQNYPTTQGTYSTGDGIKMGRSMGAQLVDMDRVLVHPIGFVDPADPGNKTKYLGPEALRISGFVLIDPSTGKRFCNEIDRLDNISNAIDKLGITYPNSGGSHYVFCLLGAEGLKLFGPSIGFYRDRMRLFTGADSIQGLVEIMAESRPASTTSVPGENDGDRQHDLEMLAQNLQQTLEDYDASMDQGRCSKTGKTDFLCKIGTKGPFAIAAVSPSIHYTLGGLLISAVAEVQQQRCAAADIIDEGGLRPKKMQQPQPRCFIHATDQPIAGLFAAGEVSAGLHGASRLGGNTLLESVVFGRLAGDRAATILQRNPNAALSVGAWTWLTVREIRRPSTEKSKCGEQQQDLVPEAGVGMGSIIIVLNLPGATQLSGLELCQFVSLRIPWDGSQIIAHYSPVTLPDEPGAIGLLAKLKVNPKSSQAEENGKTSKEEKVTPIAQWLEQLRPGDAVEVTKHAEGLALQLDTETKSLQILQTPSARPSQLAETKTTKPPLIRNLGLIAGGTGLAPMLQLISAVRRRTMSEIEENDSAAGASSAPLLPKNFSLLEGGSVNLVYAAECVEELSFHRELGDLARDSPDFTSNFVVRKKAPQGGSEEAPLGRSSSRTSLSSGFVDQALLEKLVKSGEFPPPPPTDCRSAEAHQQQSSTLIVVCGPPPMQNAILGALRTMGYEPSLCRTVDGTEEG